MERIRRSKSSLRKRSWRPWLLLALMLLLVMAAIWLVR